MWEPPSGAKRLMPVRTFVRLSSLILALTFVAAPTSVSGAQEPAGPWSMALSVGMEGFVDPSATLPVTVDLTSQELLVGRIDVSSGGTTVRTDIEVPAGGVKQYFIEGGAPGNRTQVDVALVRVNDDGEDETLLEETVRVTAPREELLVGLLGADDIATTLRSAEPRTVERTVTPVRLSAATLEAGPGVLSYLVIGPDAAADLSSAALSKIESWIEDGGRIIAASASADVFAAPGAGMVWPGTPVEVTRVGRGEVGATPNLAEVTADEWSVLLRPEPPLGLVRNEADSAAPFSLVSAAAVGREASVPALPWLLAGILVFVVLVGPVNFLLLRSFGKPEWAWVTVPLLSVAFVAGFWAIGRSQLKDFTITHASVVVDDGSTIRGETALVVQVATGGTRDLTLPEGWEATPAAAQVGGLPGVPERRDDGRDGFEFELEDLGAGVAQASWDGGDPADLEVSVGGEGNQRIVSVTNTSRQSYWAWGVIINGAGYSGKDELAPGATASVDVRLSNRRVLYEPVISEAVNRTGFVNGFSDNRYQLVSSLAAYAEHLEKGIRLDDVYFYGFTNDARHTMALDGSSGSAEGTTLMVERLEVSVGDVVETSVRPRLLDVVGASSIEGYYDDIYAYGAEEVYFVYEVPTGAPARGTVNPATGQFPRASAFDWTSGDYATIEWGEPFDISHFVSPGGELVIRAQAPEDRDPFEGDFSIQLNRYQLTWSTA